MSRHSGTLSGSIVGLLALTAGCGAPLDEQEQLSQGSSTEGWNLVGLTFGTSGSQAPQSYDEATDVIVTRAGQILVSGYENGRFGLSSVDPGGDAAAFIYGYTDLGSQLTRSTSFRLGAGNGTAEVIEALALSPGSSDIYLAGRTTGSVSSTISGCSSTPNAGQYDLFFGWVTNAGANAPRCLFQTGSNRPQHPRHLTVSSANELVIAGFDDVYVPSNYVEAWENPFLTRARRSGNGIQLEAGWPLVYNTSVPDVLHGMASGPEAASAAYITTTTQSGTSRGVAIHKVGLDKTIEWTYIVSRIGYDVGGGLHRLPDGDVLFVGTTYANLGGTIYGEQDVVLLRLSPSMELRWVRQYGTEVSDFATDLAVASDGSIYIVGETLGSFDPTIINDGTQADVFVLRVDSDGNNMIAFQLAGAGDEKASAITVGPNNDVYVAGSSTAPLFGLPHRGQRDAFLFRVRAPQIIGPF